MKMPFQPGRRLARQRMQRLEVRGSVGIEGEIGLEAVRIDTEHRRLPAQPDSAVFTMPLALAKSICPAYFARKTPITLPMSFMPAAPVSVTAAVIAAFTS